MVELFACILHCAASVAVLPPAEVCLVSSLSVRYTEQGLVAYPSWGGTISLAWRRDEGRPGIGWARHGALLLCYPDAQTRWPWLEPHAFKEIVHKIGV